MQAPLQVMCDYRIWRWQWIIGIVEPALFVSKIASLTTGDVIRTRQVQAILVKAITEVPVALFDSAGVYFLGRDQKR